MKRRNMVLFTWYVGKKGKTGSAPIFGMEAVNAYNMYYIKEVALFFPFGRSKCYFCISVT